jgi:hypothetical protein
VRQRIALVLLVLVVVFAAIDLAIDNAQAREASVLEVTAQRALFEQSIRDVVQALRPLL